MLIPDWTREVASDQRLADFLQERLDNPRLLRHERARIVEFLKKLEKLGFTPSRRKENS